VVDAKRAARHAGIAAALAGVAGALRGPGQRLPQLAVTAAVEVMVEARAHLDGDPLLGAGLLPGDLLDADLHAGALLGIDRGLPAGAVALIRAAAGAHRQHVI